MNEQAFCLWFSGLSASGKTTLARMLEEALLERGLAVEVLDGEAVRADLGRDLGFTREDRMTNLRRIAYLAKLLTRNGIVVLVAAITPYQDFRDEARQELGCVVEAFLDCPLEVCIQRDPKGLYKRALAGEIKHFSGLDEPFERPCRPEIELRTDLESPDECLEKIIRALELMGMIPAVAASGYSEEESELIEKRLKDLGYI
ncbi:MAG: adenylyl-sulfate kinase [Pseudomonadota bacterium]